MVTRFNTLIIFQMKLLRDGEKEREPNEGKECL